MKLLVKFNLILIALILAGLAVVSYIAHSFLIDNARAQVMQQAELMMESASSMRKYTSEELKPLLIDNPRSKSEFLPQTVPAYGATVTFARLREKFPEYTYKEATLNPTNLQDRAADWESDVIEHFRNNPQDKELSGERATPTGRSLFLAHPISAEKSCMECHSVPAAAPQTMIDKYGSANGFGWKLHDIVAAQIISVPTEIPVRIATSAFRTLMWSLTGAFAAILLAVNLTLYFIIILPVRRLSHVSNQISLGQMDAIEIPVRGSDEIAELTRACNRLFVTVSKALRMLG
jgi:HAMP domain-containing protein